MKKKRSGCSYVLFLRLKWLKLRESVRIDSILFCSERLLKKKSWRCARPVRWPLGKSVLMLDNGFISFKPTLLKRPGNSILNHYKQNGRTACNFVDSFRQSGFVCRGALIFMFFGKFFSLLWLNNVNLYIWVPIEFYLNSKWFNGTEKFPKIMW